MQSLPTVTKKMFDDAIVVFSELGSSLFQTPLVLDVRDMEYFEYFDDPIWQSRALEESRMLQPIGERLREADEWNDQRAMTPSQRMAIYQDVQGTLATKGISLDQFFVVESTTGTLSVMFSPRLSTPALLRCAVQDRLQEHRVRQPKLDWAALDTRFKDQFSPMREALESFGMDSCSLQLLQGVRS